MDETPRYDRFSAPYVFPWENVGKVEHHSIFDPPYTQDPYHPDPYQQLT